MFEIYNAQLFLTGINWGAFLPLLIALLVMMGMMGGFIWINYFTASEIGKKEGGFARFIQLVVAVLGIMILLLLPLVSLANALDTSGLGAFIKAHPKPTALEIKLLHMTWTPATIFHTVTGVLQLLVLLPPVRWLLHKTLFWHINPMRRVHTIALVFWITAMSLLIYTSTLAYEPEKYVVLFKLLPIELMAPAQTILFILFCPLALGFLLKRNWSQMIERLGLYKISLKQIPLFVGMALVAVIAVLLVQPLLMPYTDPQAIKVAESMSEALIGSNSIQSVLLIGAIVAISAGVGEELIFRGLLQPVLGWFATNLLFTVMHCHYGLSPLMALLFVVALLFVWVRKKYGTIAAMIVHASFDFLMVAAELILRMAGS